MASPIANDPVLQQQMQRLHRLMLYGRWLVVGLLWLVVGSLSLWSLRSDIALWMDYFTWVAVRYALIYNRPAALGLSVCIGMTVAVCIWQSRIVLWGLSRSQTHYLERQVIKIRQQGKRHPLWHWVCGPSKEQQFP